MYPKLTYLYILTIFAVGLATSCASDAPASEQETPERGAELIFMTADLTRAVTTSFDEFAVFGDMWFRAENNSALEVIFDSIPVKRANNKWTYEGTQYWYPKHEHSFIAVTPLSALAAGTDYYTSKLGFTYTVPTASGVIGDKNDVTDILVATHRRYYAGETDANKNLLPVPGVTLRFNHILALVNVAATFDDATAGSDGYLEFSKMELSGLHTQATFNIQPATITTGNQTDNGIVEATGQGSASLTVDFAQPVRVKNDGQAIKLFADSDALILLPQTFAADSEAKVVLTYKASNESSIKQVTLPLSNQKLEPGKSYTFRFSIEKAGPKFGNTSIDDWSLIRHEEVEAK